MDIRHLKTFKTIVDVGGFMKAAEHLGYAQPTVTGHVRAIEQELGQPLFNRLGKRMILTETGKHLLPYANEIVALMDKALQLPSDEEKMAGEIVIGASESLTTYRLPPIIKAFKKQYPKVRIILKPLISSDLFKELKQGETDLAFLMDRMLTEDDLRAEPLITERMVLVFPENAHTTSKNDLLSAGGTILYTEQGCAYRALFDKLLHSSGYVPGNTLEFWSIEAIKQCIMCGLGFSFLPLVAVRAEWGENKLVCITTDEDQVVTQMVYHKNKWLSPSVRAFMNLVLEQAKGWQEKEY
ncbi:LysR family transcriptional regulator [Sporolactobacillus pectinivorans]|uniref:LysR family transcriptional regulator n=1 Tax=Sporolactobacillus pectinivorans TaxID=1591408 RepID=UPI000C26835B|nr:LysR family transcriptional regulator [Sporolactobacillus pectinivorans]